ncbi:MAG: hypothetical protein M3365_02930 [Gemmatimonadota bacterium]|nr:hypothetical protein [Gemmatimonadota bacterium]
MNPPEQLDQLSSLFFTQRRKPTLVFVFDYLVEAVNEPAAFRSDAGGHHPAVAFAPGSGCEPGVLKAVEQPGSVRHPAQQALPDFIPAQAVGLRPAQDSQHIVLSPGNPVGLQELFE